jgi:translation initiation factor 1 (eIF-1/SUI1)
MYNHRSPFSARHPEKRAQTPIFRTQVIIETNTRNKKKMITTVTGLDLFGVKLSEASKAFGKKFACGCSVTKSPTGTEQIDMQARTTVFSFNLYRSGRVFLAKLKSLLPALVLQSRKVLT